MIATQPGCSKGKKQKLILFFSFPPLCSLPQRLLVLAHALCPPPPPGLASPEEEQVLPPTFIISGKSLKEENLWVTGNVDMFL